ncbi:MAG: hypothetical protein ACREKM_04125, partial [Longimicrobiales bacterium]
RVPDPQVAPGGPPAGGPASAGSGGGRPGVQQTERERDEHNFRKMEREARERAAEARLEELKRKLR